MQILLNKMSIHDQDFWVRETLSMLALSLIEGVGYWTLYKLSSSGLTFSEILRKPSNQSEFIDYFIKVGCKPPRNIQSQWEDFRKELWAKGNELYRSLKKENIEVIHFKQEIFPKSLQHIQEPPQWLFIQGNISILNEASIAIVGTRTPSEDGTFLARYIGGCIPYLKAVTVSGLANGIDQIIHKQSIRFQIPTIAILGNGIFLNYPTGSENLRSDICANGGAIVTEYLPYQRYSGENFVRRNRLQAGLADVVIPVEWKASSGTAHTVHYAHKAKKHIVCLKMPDWSEKSHQELVLAKDLKGEIFTIPGEEDFLLNRITSYLSRNSNKKNLSIERKKYYISNSAEAEVEPNYNLKDKRTEKESRNVNYPRQLSLWSDESVNTSGEVK